MYPRITPGKVSYWEIRPTNLVRTPLQKGKNYRNSPCMGSLMRMQIQQHAISTTRTALTGVEFVWSPKCGLDLYFIIKRKDFCPCGSPRINQRQHPPGRMNRSAHRHLPLQPLL